MEVTKLLKPPVYKGRKGDSASMQAVTRVNAEQASKTIMQVPTRRRLGEGRRGGRVRANSFRRTCRGSGDGMQAKGTKGNTGSPSGDCNRNQLATRERQAGPYGVTERPVLPGKPGNTGGGKGPQLKTDARSSEGREIGNEPINSSKCSETADGVACKSEGIARLSFLCAV